MDTMKWRPYNIADTAQDTQQSCWELVQQSLGIKCQNAESSFQNIRWRIRVRDCPYRICCPRVCGLLSWGNSFAAAFVVAAVTHPKLRILRRLRVRGRSRIPQGLRGQQRLSGFTVANRIRYRKYIQNMYGIYGEFIGNIYIYIYREYMGNIYIYI